MTVVAQPKIYVCKVWRKPRWRCHLSGQKYYYEADSPRAAMCKAMVAYMNGYAPHILSRWLKHMPEPLPALPVLKVKEA